MITPDLNPIEFMWKDLKKRLSEYYQENVDSLKRIGQLIRVIQEKSHPIARRYLPGFRQTICLILVNVETASPAQP